MSFHRRTSDVCKGKWKGVFLSLGVAEKSLTGRHGPCPICQGTDRFRFDNIDGRGSSICGHCGGRDGMQLAMELLGTDFATTASKIDQIVGNVKADAPQRPAMTEDDVKRALRTVWGETVPVAPGDLVHRYLDARGLAEMVYPPALRFGAALRDGEGGLRPAMVALVGVPGETDERGRQRYCTMHRTFLRPDGLAKAEMERPRKLMPGTVPDGACVMLSDYTGGPLGIAEGIETAMAASALFGLPVWSAISAPMLAKWRAPAGCDDVTVFSDCDPRFGGQAAAYTLAHRLTAKVESVTVKLPDRAGMDWADIWAAQRGKA